MFFLPFYQKLERGSYSIYSYLPRNSLDYASVFFSLLWVKVSWQAVFKEMKTMNTWTKLLNSSMGCRGKETLRKSVVPQKWKKGFLPSLSFVTVWFLQ